MSLVKRNKNRKDRHHLVKLKPPKKDIDHHVFSLDIIDIACGNYLVNGSVGVPQGFSSSGKTVAFSELTERFMVLDTKEQAQALAMAEVINANDEFYFQVKIGQDYVIVKVYCSLITFVNICQSGVHFIVCGMYCMSITSFTFNVLMLVI